LLTAILLSDSNLDFSMTEPEMDRLMLRLQCASVVDEEKLRELLGGMMSPSSSPTKKIREIEACIAADDVFFDE
jgi:ethanolamine ammonia-lyase large subunit